MEYGMDLLTVAGCMTGIVLVIAALGWWVIKAARDGFDERS
jgi:hypothetical protein